MLAPPLQVVDSFLLQYNTGDAVLALFVLGLLATIPLKSRKVTTLHTLVFGLLLLILPGQMLTVNASGAHLLGSVLQYKMLGLGLLVASPIVYSTS
ncbi:hypothetical protein [Salinibaculum rarum]|jgi:hypothetical protein|uniref:hypothetical protein n=1 Tax=Salinibaculum rarum TaxID=3058903 RepID=UPI00265D6350|nr:hypothetical protein [Salinibaculum sp. KK48]